MSSINGAHGAGERLTVGAHQLFRGEVGHHQGAGNDDARKPAARQEVTLFGRQILILGLPPGQDRHKYGEPYELNNR